MKREVLFFIETFLIATLAVVDFIPTDAQESLAESLCLDVLDDHLIDLFLQ
jgi:hypothetical protein